MKDKTAFLKAMNLALSAIDSLRFMGFDVIGMKFGNYNPVITVEVPKDKSLLKKAPVVAVRNDLAKCCSHVQVARFNGCLVEWEAPEELVNQYNHLPDIGGFELAEAAGGE